MVAYIELSMGFIIVLDDDSTFLGRPDDSDEHAGRSSDEESELRRQSYEGENPEDGEEDGKREPEEHRQGG